MNDSEITWKNEPVRKVKWGFQRYYLESILEPIGFQLRIDLNNNYDDAFRFFISGANNKHTVSPESLHSKDALSKNRSPLSI